MATYVYFLHIGENLNLKVHTERKNEESKNWNIKIVNGTTTKKVIKKISHSKAGDFLKTCKQFDDNCENNLKSCKCSSQGHYFFHVRTADIFYSPTTSSIYRKCRNYFFQLKKSRKNHLQITEVYFF